ncbi:DUF4334 domain-containing protein [Streptomyces griseoviridis]|jgi:hypothetical protein|uniref:DUF4334 domain-containing protein n=3 Tax=Streptomyces TaxID=1883 RepID=A0ABT9LRF4_STRGD|nr:MULTISPECIES: DUF4334 domain-containing protein [Streptomyces]MDP9686131.1 hypothetical protein [Streptomyces griseoviridis]GGS46094.1 hypothetical protein GCM10010238_39810 [Streptomyces niveoruber]GGS79601.1 hypothetical protein GCM10010240_11210 [Streptomyces griseoviridis]GGU16998.1 hypothetical protein GCM10010259_04360 [Streptomyces daghestanicus]GHI35417.1 hypothetical protein Sdagh_71470 [Streptomyces daghestanicus]
MDIDEARGRFAVLRGKESAVSAEELDAVWAALPTVRVEEILGAWRGGEFDTGHPLNGRLRKSGWYGKTFHSAADAKPLIMRGEDGRLHSDTTLGKGEASLWMVEFRGEVTATMVYDGQPVLDHFKAVDDRTLMGIMNGKGFGDGPFFYFFLERD